jgi:hypothetical protein
MLLKERIDNALVEVSPVEGRRRLVRVRQAKIGFSTLKPHESDPQQGFPRRVGLGREDRINRFLYF